MTQPTSRRATPLALAALLAAASLLSACDRRASDPSAPTTGSGSGSGSTTTTPDAPMPPASAASR